MNRACAIALSLACGIVVAAMSMFAPSRAADADHFRPLFNGKDLEGWVATKPELWSVKDGIIIGKKGKNQIATNTFLATKEKYTTSY